MPCTRLVADMVLAFHCKRDVNDYVAQGPLL